MTVPITSKLINRNFFISNPYRTINAILAACILLIFVYSAIFSPDKGRHPVPSSHKVITGEDTTSTGLSRGFSAIFRLKFEQARAYNRYSLRIFMFFLIQFFLRIVFIFNQGIIIEMGESRFVMLDAILSSVFFLFIFEPFLKELF